MRDARDALAAREMLDFDRDDSDDSDDVPLATLDDLREAVTLLEDLAPTARRVLGGSYPVTTYIERDLRDARAALRARETPPAPGSS